MKSPESSIFRAPENPTILTDFPEISPVVPEYKVLNPCPSIIYLRTNSPADIYDLTIPIVSSVRVSIFPMLSVLSIKLAIEFNSSSVNLSLVPGIAAVTINKSSSFLESPFVPA